MQLDGALREVCSVLLNAQTNPALRVRLQSLDLNYSALLRKAYEALQAAQEEEEEGAVSAPEKPEGKPDGKPDGKPEGSSIQARLAALLKDKVPAVPAAVEWPAVTLSHRAHV